MLAIRGAKTDTIPAAYAQFAQERAFYRYLGWTYRDLYERPRQQVILYSRIISLLLAEEKATIDRQNRDIEAQSSRRHR